MSNLDETKCPFCNSPCNWDWNFTRSLVVKIPCPRCTPFFVRERELSYADKVGLPSQWRNRLSALLFERHTQRPRALPPLLIVASDVTLPDCVNESGEAWAAPVRVMDVLGTWPGSVPDQLDRAICLLSQLHANPGQEFRPKGDEKVLPHRWLVAADETEAKYLQEHLLKIQWIEHPTPVSAAKVLRITPTGWGRVAELKRTRSALTNPAFVARWFGKPKPHEKDAADRTEEMRQLVDDFIFPAIDAAGYLRTKADTEDYNTGIMDKIHFDIRRAPFVVADFTNHNLGVYYEAGMAVGHGIPVIPCCPQSYFKEKHFDIAHVNLIVYDSPAELRDRLERRILGSIGEGPFRREHDEIRTQ